MTDKKNAALGRTDWIVVTGLDGSGKTTLVTRLEEYFRQHSLRVKRSRLPHDEHIVKDLLNVSKSKYTDRLLFAVDNRIFAERYAEWLKEGYDIILTQRGFLDSFVHGAVQGYTYDQIATLNQIEELPKCQVMIHLVAEAETAYKRIQNDPEADKFEYIEYIRKQETETRRAFYECEEGNITHFKECINIYIDTTQMTEDEVFELSVRRLMEFNVI